MSFPSSLTLVSCATGLVLNPDIDSESEDSEPDDPDDPVIPSPETDDVKGEKKKKTGLNRIETNKVIYVFLS